MVDLLEREADLAVPVGTVAHPAARRVRDVLRSRAAAPRSFVVDDEDNVREAVRQGVRIEALYATAAAADVRDAVARDLPARVARYVLADDVATALFGTERRSRFFALARRPRLPGLDEVLARPGDVVVLDGVRLVGNIGAVTRSAAAFGAAGVVLVDSGLVSTLDRRLVRASRGLVLALPVVLAGRRETSRALARAGIPVATLSPDAPAPLRAVRDVRRRVALVLGGERRGVDPDRWGRGGLRLTIPMTGAVESLNVSVAAALALYERQAAVAEPARAPVGAAPVDYPR